MRKIFKSFMLVAAAAMAFASCQKEEAAAPETVSATLTMHADVEQTKTYLGEDNAVLWGKGEAVTLYVGSGETAKFFDSTSTDDHEGAESASFTFEIDGVTEADTYALGGIYPASASNGINNDNPESFKIALPATQKAEPGKYDPSAYIMVLKPETVEALPSEYTASFRRAVALNKITLTNVKEDISSVEIMVPEKKYLAGRRYMNLTTGDSGEVYYDKSSTISVNSAFTGNSIDVWFCSWGVELAAGEELTITMKSATKSYTRTITANENGIKFVEGDLNTLKINMASAIVEDTGDFSGEWLITGVKDEQVYAASAYVSGNNLKSVAISIEDGQILEVDGIANCMMTLTKIADGDYAGMYTITDVNGKYLYAAAPSENQLKGATEVSVNAYWTVELQENGTYSIVASKSSNRNVMQFNGSVATNILFNCYSSASQSPVTLYPYSMVKADTTPRITVEDTEYNVSADDETLEFSYTTKNIDGTPAVSVADGATMTNVQADAEAGIVTVIFDANAEEEEKTATLVLSYEGAESVSVTITQAAKAAEGAAYYEKVTSAPADWSGEYLLVYESDKYLFDGSLTDVDSSPNYITLQSISDRLSFADYSQYAVTIEKYETGYSVKTASGYYIGRSANSNGFNSSTSTPYVNTLSFEDGMIKIAGSGGRVFNYNSQSGKFRFFASTNAPLVSAYKLVGGNEGGETPVEKTLESIAVSDAKTEYTVGDEFVEPTVTATYSDGSTEDVTASAEFTGYDMSAADTYTVTVSYSGKTTTYSITVSAAQDGGETTGGYTLVTSLSDITTGQYVIAAKVDGTYYAMSNTFASKINGTSVTVTDNAISESDAVNYVVTITKNGTSFSISSGTKYLKYNSSTNLGTQTTAYNWTITAGTNGTFRATSETSGRGILYRAGDYNQFGGYALSNVTSTSTEYFDIELFKLN